jgi:hypothetical protein
MCSAAGGKVVKMLMLLRIAWAGIENGRATAIGVARDTRTGYIWYRWLLVEIYWTVVRCGMIEDGRAQRGY